MPCLKLFLSYIPILAFFLGGGGLLGAWLDNPSGSRLLHF